MTFGIENINAMVQQQLQIQPNRSVRQQLRAEPRTVLAQITLAPSNQDYQYLKICKIEPINGLPRSVMRKRNTTVYAPITVILNIFNERCFEMTFIRNTINDQLFQQYFNGSYFKIEEPYELIIEKKRIRLMIYPGNYLIKQMKTAIVVRFDY